MNLTHTRITSPVLSLWRPNKTSVVRGGFKCVVAQVVANEIPLTRTGHKDENKFVACFQCCKHFQANPIFFLKIREAFLVRWELQFLKDNCKYLL